MSNKCSYRKDLVEMFLMSNEGITVDEFDDSSLDILFELFCRMIGDILQNYHSRFMRNKINRVNLYDQIRFIKYNLEKTNSQRYFPQVKLSLNNQHCNFQI